ncbi:mRNA-decapping enzyme-like protein [Stegodyphus dumicola]|uniref:mRNA-decapping enzyme-like protein n=1 Tax=Stegodyphus dumicola TaxID=202533 RepID=UPI0015B17531|nr:mRNA-decapping enzyme-like protein [Stegodyphus dumicola]
MPCDKMAASSETQINLKTLQRVDSRIVEIIDNASQVAIYKYERKLEKWEGTDIEGTLFLYRRSFYPHYGFIIVNRMSTTNFIESITSDMQFQLQEPYLLYKNHAGEIIGSWFYEHEDLRRITKRMQTIVLKQVSTPKRQRCASESETKPKQDVGQDIIALLSQAHEKYMAKESTPKCMKNNLDECANPLVENFKTVGNNELLDSLRRNKVSGNQSIPKFPASPQRRYSSAVSFKPIMSSSPPYLASNEHLTKLFQNGISENRFNNLDFKTLSSEIISPTDFTKETCDVYNSSAPTRLSPLFSQNEISSPLSDIGILEDSFDSSYPQPHFMSMSQVVPTSVQFAVCENQNLGDKICLSTYDCNPGINMICLKQTLLSHLEDQDDILIKVHEAYISSLKSHFSHIKN